jgi:hypothetical protein
LPTETVVPGRGRGIRTPTFTFSASAREYYSAVPRTSSADAETVNDRLEARIGADYVILRVDVDEEHPVVMVLIRFFQPVESEGAVTHHQCEVRHVIRPATLT